MLYAELGSGNTGSMGTANDHRFSNRIPLGTIPKQAPKQPQSFLKRAEVNRFGSAIYVVQRGSHETPPFRESARVLLNPISGTQKGWGYKTSHQPEETQRIHPSPALQDRGHSYCKRPAKREQLASQGRSEGCIFHGSNPRVRQKIPFFGEGKLLQIHLPPLRSIMCPLGLYQDLKASDGNAQRAKGEASVI